MSHNWKPEPGMEMILCSRSWGPLPSFGGTVKIAKVYKNGNFITDDDPKQQWRPAMGRAYRTGADYLSTYLVPLTDTVLAEKARADQYNAARKTIDAEAERLRRLRDVDEVIAEAAMITARARS